MISGRTISTFVIAVTTLLISFNVYLALDGLDGNTYSERIVAWSKTRPWLPLLIITGFGAVTGHWFLRKGREGFLIEWLSGNWAWGLVYLGVFAVAAVLAGRYW